MTLPEAIEVLHKFNAGEYVALDVVQEAVSVAESGKESAQRDG